jgi:hypothetical protein
LAVPSVLITWEYEVEKVVLADIGMMTITVEGYREGRWGRGDKTRGGSRSICE